jgi:uncharacterized protein
MDLYHFILLFPISIIAGAVNSIAGGGTFFTFPVLILMGLPPLIANTTNKTGLAIASLAGVAGFWREIRAIRHLLMFFVPLGIIGSIIGSYVLLEIQLAHFNMLVPWLMLTATLLFALGGRLIKKINPRKHQGTSTTKDVSIGLGQFAIGVYGGFFAAGMGILMLALYELAGIKNINEMNALKVVVALGINIISAGVFLLTGSVDWPVAAILIFGATIGGYSGAVISKKLPTSLIRTVIILYGCGMTTYFFLK